MSKKPRENRVPIMMSEEEITAIDEWRYRNRIATRSDAIRRLVLSSIILENHKAEIADAVNSETENLTSFMASITELLQEEGIRDLTTSEKRRAFAKNFADYQKSSYLLILSLAPVLRPLVNLGKVDDGIGNAWENARSEIQFFQELRSLWEARNPEAILDRIEARKKAKSE